jgi:hypothetical protein
LREGREQGKSVSVFMAFTGESNIADFYMTLL